MGLGLYNIENPMQKAAAAQHSVAQTLGSMTKAEQTTTTSTTKEKKSGGILDILEPVMAIGGMVAKGYGAFATGGMSLLF